MRYTNLCFLFLLFFAPKLAFSQMPTDGLMMPEGQLCVLGQYSNSHWNEYWEGKNLRTNANLGTMTTQSGLVMGNYGIKSNFNVMLGLPYVWTSSSDSYLAGQHGFQDLAVFLKYQALEKTALNGAFKVQATGGLSTPITNYPGDFLPFSIGVHCKTASLRAIVNYTANMGLYVTAQAGHTWRSSVTLDRDSYIFDNELVYSDEMPVPNVMDYSARLGFIKPRFQTEIWYDAFPCLSGDDIRYNEGPQASNQMAAAQVGWFGKGFITKQWALQLSLSQVLNGRNAGKSLTINAGTTYLFTLHSKAEPSK